MLMDSDLGGRINFFGPNGDGDKDEAPLPKADAAHVGCGPWPAPKSADLFDEIRCAFNAQVVLCPYGDVAGTLWAVHTHCYRDFSATPRLFIHAPTIACGKTTLLDLLEKLVCRPLPTSDVTGAALLRAIQEMEPTILVDEHDSMAYSETLRNVYNSGFQQGKKTLRAGAAYDTFAPLALASTSPLPPAMLSRSIVLRLQRKLATEIVKPVRTFDGTEIKRKMARWGMDNGRGLRPAQPEIPGGIHDWTADAWAPLLAIADPRCLGPGRSPVQL
jgi:hypothetical protein